MANESADVRYLKIKRGFHRVFSPNDRGISQLMNVSLRTLKTQSQLGDRINIDELTLTLCQRIKRLQTFAKMVVGSQITIIAYQLYNDRNIVRYAASTFTKQSKTEMFSKSAHKSTALQRFYKCPVWVEYKSSSHWKSMQFFLERCVFALGVKGTRGNAVVLSLPTLAIAVCQKRHVRKKGVLIVDAKRSVCDRFHSSSQ